MTPTRTRAAHRRSFARAPRVRAGEHVRHLRDDEEHPGWFLGVGPDGVEGYFPAAWFEPASEPAIRRARRDYDAMELTIAAGVEVESLEEVSGWLLVRRVDDGATGWVPVRALR